MNVLGVDPSLTSTGVCMSDDETMVFQPKTKGPERLIQIRNFVNALVRAHSIDLIAIEGYSFSSRNSHAHALGELGGVLRVDFYEHGIPYVEIPPTSRAKFATGKGNASKTEVVSSISARTGIVWSGSGSDDMCDAWILRQMVLAHLGESSYSWPESHLAALEKIEWRNEP